MAEKYGIQTRLLTGDASAPVSSSSCLVYFGTAYNSKEHYATPQKINTYKEYIESYHAGVAPSKELSLDHAAQYALSLVSGVWFVNCAETASEQEVQPSAIKDVLEDSLAHIILNTSDVPNVICIPGVQDTLLLQELAKLCDGGMVNSIHAQGFVDCAQTGAQVKANGDPDALSIVKPSSDGVLISAWGNAILSMDDVGSVTKSIPASIVLSSRRVEQDAINTNGVPYRSIGNLRVNILGVCVKDDDAVSICTCREDKMNEVVENGVVSFVNRGSMKWYTWGDHTSAVTAGAVDDQTYRFDSNVAVLFHILNRFVQKWGAIIDSPMTLRTRDCIVSEEQDYLNGLVAMGCLVGDPRCEFRPVDNSASTIGAGQFYFTNIATVTPPAKYVDLGIQYTDKGLAYYIEEGNG